MPSGQPRVLDLFCGAGGASMGLHRAGFEVVGVDHRPQPRYPFEFHLADALDFPLDGFDAYWASPPCQLWSRVRHFCTHEPEDLIEATRERLVSTGKPYIIENVPGAPLHDPVMLCGTMFGLKVRRHRHFECSFPLLLAPASCSCMGKAGYTNAYGGVSSFERGAKLICVVGKCFVVADARAAMGIPWMNAKELAQAVPPAYAEWLGRQMLITMKGAPCQE